MSILYRESMYKYKVLEDIKDVMNAESLVGMMCIDKIWCYPLTPIS